MIPVVTPAQMAAVDAAAPEPVEVLIERAGEAVARAAADMMGGRYGRRAVVLAGPGNNGADGRAAARRLRRGGVRVGVFSAVDAPGELPPADLYIDAAFGTGLSRPYSPPERARPEAPVLAVDIPSGLDGLTGQMLGGPVGTTWPWSARRQPSWLPGEVLDGLVPTAQRTVTFAALKPGLLFGDGPSACGEVTVADIGLEVPADDRDACALVEDADVEALPTGTGATHKWHAAALVVAGSVGMGGAAALACEAALLSGARLVHLSAPADVGARTPTEIVCSEPPLTADPARFDVCAAGPGLGTDDSAAARLAEVLALGLPAVVDADGLRLLRDPAVADVLAQRRRRSVPLVLTPHDAELDALVGRRPGADRIKATRAAAAEMNAIVLLKGGPTVVAEPDGRVRVVNSGDARLATAGTGDVLTGMIAGRLAAFGPHLNHRIWRTIRVPGIPCLGPHGLLHRVAEAAHLHGRAAAAAGGARLVAGDLLRALRSVTP